MRDRKGADRREQPERNRRKEESGRNREKERQQRYKKRLPFGSLENTGLAEFRLTGLQLVVTAFLFHELVVVAAFDNLTMFEYQNSV